MRHLAILIVCSSLLLSCNSRKRQGTSKEDQAIPDTVVTNVSTQDPKDSTSRPAALNRPFQDQVFLIGRDVDFVEAECDIHTGCDGCSLMLHFLPSDRFAYVSYEMEEVTYFAGDYSVDSTNLILAFDRRYITEFMDDEMEVKEGDLGYKYFQIEHCKGKIHLLDKSNSNATHGIRFEPDSEKRCMQVLLESKAWKRLNP